MRHGKEDCQGSCQTAWSLAEATATTGDQRLANVMRLVALANALAVAETAVLVGDGAKAVASLRSLQTYTSIMVAKLEQSPVA